MTTADAPCLIAVEGATDRFCGRPENRNPYGSSSDAARWWRFGWVEADALLELRAAAEAARWLREAA